ncbi:MAG: hypothetical protein HOB73_08185 [Planctomycetaceae bacterium]|nr:hypothetical protein [Planctomycetaceae bacterium]
MAKQEFDREDILREATVLVNRVELEVSGRAADDAIVFGFRECGSLAIYFGAEPVYQFNADHALRRAYHQGCLLKAVDCLLVNMRRERQDGKLQLLSTSWDEGKTKEFIGQIRQDMSQLVEAIAAGEVQVNRFVTAEQQTTAEILTTQLCNWCHDHLPELQVARVPGVSG